MEEEILGAIDLPATPKGRKKPAAERMLASRTRLWLFGFETHP